MSVVAVERFHAFDKAGKDVRLPGAHAAARWEFKSEFRRESDGRRPYASANLSGVLDHRALDRFDLTEMVRALDYLYAHQDGPRFRDVSP